MLFQPRVLTSSAFSCGFFLGALAVAGEVRRNPHIWAPALLACFPASSLFNMLAPEARLSAFLAKGFLVGHAAYFAQHMARLMGEASPTNTPRPK